MTPSRYFPARMVLILHVAWAAGATEYPWRVGAAVREIAAEDAMVIGGGIGPGFTRGQEGKLQASALMIHGEAKLCLVAVDVLMMTRDHLDAAAREIAARCGVPFDHILINASHTHHAPSTVTIHGYTRDEEFCRRAGRAIVEAAVAAEAAARASPQSRARFRLGQEATVGQNSRYLLPDGQIYWVGPRDAVVRPTDPFDPDLPVMAFESEGGALRAAWFNHSTHCIGTRTGRRSPGFYGLAAQELSDQHGAPFLFLSGAAGSTHNWVLKADEMVHRLKEAANAALAGGELVRGATLRAIRRELPFTVRTFDERKEDEAVATYCRKYVPSRAEMIIGVFRESRRQLATLQGEARRTWVQVLRIGEVYLVAVPAEFFTALGLEIKRRSPHQRTFLCGLSNDYIGYTPTREAFALGGYQTWTGLHSFSAVGTGERIVEECLGLLRELGD